MESPSAKSNSVAMSNSSSKNDEEENHASNPELNSSSSAVAIPPIVPGAQDPLEHLVVANTNQVHDYRCKYCDKRFTNKQALGGHQNAHKTERAMEKIAHEMRQNQFAYLAGASYPVMALHPTFPGPFNYRALINRSYHSQQPVHHGVHIDHYARPLLPMAAHPYAPRASYPGWNVQMPRVPQYMEPPLQVQYNSGFAPVGMGYSSVRPVSEAHPNFTNSGLVPGRDPGSRNNNQMNNLQNQEDEDSDLDLTLRL